MWFSIFAIDGRALPLHSYDKLSRIFSCILLIPNHVISSASWNK